MKSEVRIDKWIWAVRIFKTRTAAADACKKGRVMLGDIAVKPSRTVKPGDIVKVRRPPITYTFRVMAVTENRLGAKLVPEYMENITPQSELDMLDVVRISGFIDRRKGLGRPTKRDGRKMQEFTSSSFELDFDGFDDFDDDVDQEGLD